MELEVDEVQTRPQPAEAVQVTFADWERAKAITDWCHGRLHNGTRGTFIEVFQQVGLEQGVWVRAREGDWIVKSGVRMSDTEVAGDTEYHERFESRALMLHQHFTPAQQFTPAAYATAAELAKGLAEDEPLPGGIAERLRRMGAMEVDTSTIPRPESVERPGDPEIEQEQEDA